MKISMLPTPPRYGTSVRSLLNADAIFQAELELVESTQAGGDLFLSQYTLPSINDGASNGSIASNAQRQILRSLVKQIRENRVNIYIIADNSGTTASGSLPHNQETIEYLHAMGAYVLPYPKQYVLINHSKFIANAQYAIVATANMSNHQSDVPDYNAGLLFAGVAASNGIIDVFLPQWQFAVKNDVFGWSSRYPSIHGPQSIRDDHQVMWLNTAPKEENGTNWDNTEIKRAYYDLIFSAANNTFNPYLYFEQFDLSHMGIVYALIDAKRFNSNLDIRLILDPNQYLLGANSKYDERSFAYQALQQERITVKFAYVDPASEVLEHPQLFHSKWVVSSDEEVLLGSANLSHHSLNGNVPTQKQILHNREVDARVYNSNLAFQFKGEFLNDWEHYACEDPHEASLGKAGLIRLKPNEKRKIA